MRAVQPFPATEPSLGWVRVLLDHHGHELARLVLQRGLTGQEGFLGVESCLCAFLSLPQARQIAAQHDDTRRMMSLLLGAVVQTIQVRKDSPRYPQSAGEFDPLQIRLLLLDVRSGVCEILGLSSEQREVLLAACPLHLRRAHDAWAEQNSAGRPSWDEAEFDRQIVSSQTPVLVHFIAEWCKPCHAIEPYLDELAEQRQGRLVVASVDVEKNPALTTRFRVRAVPTLLLFRDGRLLNSLVGAAPQQRLVEWVDGALAG